MFSVFFLPSKSGHYLLVWGAQVMCYNVGEKQWFRVFVFYY